MSKLLSNTISTGASWLVNRAITMHLQDHLAALLLADLVSRRDRFSEQLDSKGGFFAVSEEIETELCIGKKSRLRATKVLVDAGVLQVAQRQVQTKTHGYQTMNFYYIDDVAVAKVLSQEILQRSGEKLQRGEEKSQGCSTGSQTILPPFPNDTATDPFFLSQTERVSASSPRGAKPSLQAITDTWMAKHPDYATSAISKPDVYAELFITIKSHGYSESTVESYVGKLTRSMAEGFKDKKKWGADVQEALRRGFRSAYPVKLKTTLTVEERLSNRVERGDVIEAHELPIDVTKPVKKKSFKPIILTNEVAK